MERAQIAQVFGKTPTPRWIEDKGWVLPHLHIGVEIEIENHDGSLVPGWIHHKDDSLRNGGMEFTTGPMIGGTARERILKFCEVATKCKWAANVRTGIHIHFDCTHKDVKFPYWLAAAYLMVEPAFYGYAGEWRRWCNFCQSYYDAEEGLIGLRTMLNAIDSPKEYARFAHRMADNRYAGLNFASLHTHGTAELRILPTTFSPEVILTWINAFMCVYKFAEILELGHLDIVDIIKNEGPEALYKRIFDHPEVYESFREFYNPKEVRKALVRYKQLSAIKSRMDAGQLTLDQVIGPSLEKALDPESATILLVDPKASIIDWLCDFGSPLDALLEGNQLMAHAFKRSQKIAAAAPEKSKPMATKKPKGLGFSGEYIPPPSDWGTPSDSPPEFLNDEEQP